MSAEAQKTTVWDHPIMKRVMNGAQMLTVALLCWVGSGVGTAVKGFSDKLDGIVSSIATIAQEQMLQKRENMDLAQRVTKLEARDESQEQRLIRLGVQVEQLLRNPPNGR